MENSLADIQKITKEIEAYTTNYNSCSEIPTIEVDILLQKTRELYDLLMGLKNVPVESKVPEIQEETSVVETNQSEQTPVEKEDADYELIFKIEETEKNESAAPEVVSTEPKQDVILSKPIDLGSKLGKTHIDDIMNAISLNDKFLFRSQLFNKNQDLFAETVGKLNELKTFEEAFTFLKNNFPWDFENDADVQRFLAIVERRYL
ncbi:MAG: hypothetical protein MJ198_02240 [Bacteroidales bacterium]|nr:hypothetical protein [Bacteroidales bacterium]